MVTKLLEKAIEKVSKLSKEEQDEFAALILGELESEANWDGLLRKSSDQLGNLAKEALAEHREEKTEPLNPDDL
jgi:hypothetical protein